jgi:hypothetical protein
MEKSIMNKKIIAAAVAATMTSVAIADISITGSTKVNYTTTDYDNTTSSNAVKNETDLKIVGKNGDTQVVIGIEIDDSDSGSASEQEGTAPTGSGVDLEDVYMTTKVGDIAVKVGDWDNGNNFVRGSDRGLNKMNLSTNIGSLGLSYDSGHAGTDKVTVSTSVGGFDLKYANQVKDNEVTVSTTMGGIGINYFGDLNDTANTDRQSIELTGSFGDVGVKVVSIEAESAATITSDSWAGDFEGNTGAFDLEAGEDVMAVQLSTTVAGNKVAYTHTSVDKDTATSDKDRTINKVVVTRPLASGATFELTYADVEEDATAANSYNQLDLELSVAF